MGRQSYWEYLKRSDMTLFYYEISWIWWHTPVILTTQEAKARRSQQVWSQPGLHSQPGLYSEILKRKENNYETVRSSVYIYVAMNSFHSDWTASHPVYSKHMCNGKNSGSVDSVCFLLVSQDSNAKIWILFNWTARFGSRVHNCLPDGKKSTFSEYVALR